MKEKTRKIISIISFLFFLTMTIFILIFTLMASKGTAIAIYIFFSICILFYIYLIIAYTIRIKLPECKILSLKLNNIILCLTIFIIMCEPIVYSLNISIYEKYRKICPFTLQEVNIKSHLKRRCELYDTSKNSRYSYHYICSYNPSDEFKNYIPEKNEFKTENVLPIIRCLSVNNLIDNNDIISEFAKEYNNTNNFYCSLVFKPKKNKFINYNECNKNKSKIHFTFLFLLSLQFIILFLNKLIFSENENSIEERWREREIERAQHRYNGIQGLINLNRMLNLLRDLLNMNIIENMSESNLSTQKSDKEDENEENFEAEKTKNIIIDSKVGYEINVNINNFCKQKQNDSINLEQINVDFNSSEVIKKNENDSSF